MHRQKGFTLVEMGIHGILVMLLLGVIFSLAQHAFEKTDTGLLSKWKTEHIKAPVTNVATYIRTASDGRSGGGSLSTWGYFISGPYVALNGQYGALSLCPGLLLHGVNNSMVELGDVQRQAVHADSAVDLTLRVPRPSEKVTTTGCAVGVVAKDDHFEFEGHTLAFVTDIKGLVRDLR